MKISEEKAVGNLELSNSEEGLLQKKVSLQIGTIAEPTLNYLQDCSQVLQSFSKDVQQKFTGNGENLPTEDETFLSHLNKLSNDTKMIIMAGLIIFTALIAYTSSFPYILGGIGFMTIIIIAINSFSFRKEQEILMEKRKKKLMAVAKTQNFTTGLTSLVQEQANAIHSYSLETFLAQEQLTTNAKKGRISALEKMHGEEISKDIDITGKSLKGETERGKQRNETAIKATGIVTTANTYISKLNAVTQAKVKTGEKSMVDKTLQNNMNITTLATEALVESKKLKSKYEISIAQRNVEAEMEKIEANGNHRIRRERERTEEYRRQSGL